MNIELFIENKKKTFTAPFVPMAAKRKWLEIQANAEQRENTTTQDILDEDAEIASILTDIIFKEQFTADQLWEGQSKEYIDSKLMEAIYGKPKAKEEETSKKK